MDRTLPQCADAGALPHALPPALAERAGISPAQQQELSRLTAEANAALEDLKRNHRSAQQALERLLRASRPPEDVVLTQVERVGAAETAIRKNRVGLMLKIRALLRPEAWSNLQLQLEVE